MTVTKSCKGALAVLAFAGAALTTSQIANAQELARKYIAGEVAYAGPEVTYDGAPITIRFSTFLGPSGSIQPIWQAMWKRLTEETNGKVTIQPFWSNSLADAQTGAFEAVAAGIVDFSNCYIQLNPGGFDLQFATQLPGLIPDSAPGSRVYTEVYPEYFKETYEKRDVYMGRMNHTPPQQILSKTPIRTWEDMQGKRAWAVGKVANDSVSSLGLVPVPLTISELYPGFQSGVLDVGSMHDAGAVLFRLNEIAKYHTRVDLWTNPNEYCFNKSFFDDLPGDIQDAIMYSMQLTTQIEAQLYYAHEAEVARQTMREQGIELIEMPEDDWKKINAAYEGVVESFIEDNEAAGRPARALVADMRDLYAKYSAMSYDELLQYVIDNPVEGIAGGR